jgi:acetylornithine aminotransferase
VATPVASTREATSSSITNPDPTADSPEAHLEADQLKYMVPTYSRPTPMFARAKGCYMWDTQGRQYLDFTAGIAVVGLGHCDDEVVNVMREQSQTLMHTSNLYHNPWTGHLSKLLVQKTKQLGGMHDATAVFISNSGTEANEAALKFARKVASMRDTSGEKTELVSFHGAFHGRTMGALSVTPTTKYQTPFLPLLPGIRNGDVNCGAEELKNLVTEKTAGVIIEPIQGEGGITVVDKEFLIALAARCKEVGAVLIYDEIQCGLGRTGTFWAHATLPKEAHPDIITTAKALGNGFPIGAVITNQAVTDSMKVGDHGTTFGGNPLACAVASHVVERLSDPGMLASVKAKSTIFTEHLSRLAQRWSDQIQECRGEGLMLGLQLKPSADPNAIVLAARERGLMVLTAGQNVLRFLPALTITEAEIEKGIVLLENAMESVWGEGKQ